MVNYSAATLDATFSALSHPIRRSIIMQLKQGAASVKELAKPFEVSLPAMLKHIRILERVGLLASRKIGRQHICQLNAQPLQEAAEWLSFYEDFWEGQLDSLAAFLEEDGDAPNP